MGSFWPQTEGKCIDKGFWNLFLAKCQKDR